MQVVATGNPATVRAVTEVTHDPAEGLCCLTVVACPVMYVCVEVFVLVFVLYRGVFGNMFCVHEKYAEPQGFTESIIYWKEATIYATESPVQG